MVYRIGGCSMTIKTSSLGGGGGIPALAPDLTWPASKAVSSVGYKRITGINATAGLTTALSLTGKFLINGLIFDSMTSETYTVKLTVDGVVIWNDSMTSIGSSTLVLYGSASSSFSNSTNELGFICNTSLLLEIQSTTDTSVNLEYIARPIL